MATDYDKPRPNRRDSKEDSLNMLRLTRDAAYVSFLDEDIGTAEPVELPGADL